MGKLFRGQCLLILLGLAYVGVSAVSAYYVGEPVTAGSIAGAIGGALGLGLIAALPMVAQHRPTWSFWVSCGVLALFLFGMAVGYTDGI